MMKKIIIFGFLLKSILLFSQDNDTVNFFEQKDSKIILYLDDIGDITTEIKASYYRIAQLDYENFRYIGIVEDYYLNNRVAYKCFYGKEYLKGEVRSYYENGSIKYQGYYNKSQKDSIWTFFYDNNSVKKIILYQKGIPYVKEYYKKNGKPVFTDGNGKYKDYIIGGYKQSSKYFISGKILNGKMEGKWNWNGENCSGIEYFKEGQYVKTETFGLNDGFKDPRIISLSGFNLHENVGVYKFIAIPRSNHKSTKDAMLVPQVPVKFSSSTFSFHSRDMQNQLKYNNSIDLDSIFSKEIHKSVSNSIRKNNISNFWSLIQFTVSENNNVKNVRVLSNKDVIKNEIIQFISSNNNFQAVNSESGTIDCDVYLCIFYENGKLFIPEYNFNNQRLNISNFFN